MFSGGILLVVGLFSYLLNTKRIKSLPTIGLAVFFAGAYLFFCTDSISLYFESISGNTIVAFLAAMFYYFFLMKACSNILIKQKKIFGILSTVIAGLVFPVTIFVARITDLYFFDMWLLWAIFQGVSFVLLFIGIGFNIKNYNLTRKIILLVALVAYTFVGVKIEAQIIIVIINKIIILVNIYFIYITYLFNFFHNLLKINPIEPKMHTLYKLNTNSK
jgi:hypothetical protein